jgi:thioredoxin reductase (NADPH)
VVANPEGTSSEYDVIVVGSGPAGISAAINVAHRKRSVAVLAGQAPSGLIRKAHAIANYPGFASASGEELAAAFMRHLGELDVPLIEEKASKIIPDAEGFIVFSERAFYHAVAVVLATGVYREAEIDGEEELVGQGVSYCVTCDGRLFAGRRAVFISYAPEGEEEAAALAEDYGVAVTYLPLYPGDHRLPEGVRVLPGARPTRLARVDGHMLVSLPAEDLQVDAVFIFKHSVSPRTLLEGLASDGRHVTVGRRMETGVPGVFAAGDCTGEPYQTAKAVGEGQVAALEAVRFLRERAKSSSRDA